MKSSTTVNQSEAGKSSPPIRLQRNSIVADVDRLESILERNVRDESDDAPQMIYGVGRKTYPLSLSVVGLFCLIATSSLVLNASLVSLGSISGALLSSGMAGLYFLAGACVIANVALSHKQFRHERKTAQARVNDLSSQFIDLLKERRKWIAKIKASQTAVSSMEQSLEQADTRLGLRKVELANTIAQVKDEEDRLEEIKLNHGSVETSLAEDSSKLETLLSELLAVESSIDDKRESANRLGLDFERLEADVNTSKKVLATLQSEVIAEEGVLSDHRGSIKDAGEQIQLIIEELQETELKRCLAVESLRDAETKFSAFAGVSRDAETELLTLQESIKNAADENASWLTVIDDFETEKASVLAQTGELSRELESLNQRRNENEIAVVKLRGELDSLQEQNVAQVNQSVTLEAEASRLQQLIAHGEASLLALGDLVNAKESHLQAVCLEELETEKRVSGLLSEVGELERLVAMKSAAESESEELFVEIAKRTSILGELAKDQQNLGLELEVLQSQKQVLSSELDALQASRFEASQVESELQSSLEGLRCELRELIDERDTLLSSLKQIEEVIQIQNSSLLELEAREAASMKTAVDAEKTATDASRRAEMLNDKAAAYAEQVQAKSVEMFEYKQSLMAIRAEVRELELTKAKLRDVELAFSELNERVAERLLEEEEAAQRLAEAERQIEAKQADVALLEEQSVSLNGRMNVAVEQLGKCNLECELISLRRHELAQQVVALEEVIQEHVKQLEICKSSETEIEAEIELNKIELQNILDERLTLLDEMDTLSKDVIKLQTQVSGLTLEATKLNEARNLRLELETDDFLMQLKKRHEQKKNVEIDIEARNTELIAANALRVELNQNVESCGKQLLDAENRLQQLSEEVIEAQGIGQQWSTYLNALNEDVQALEGNREKLVLAVDKLLHQEREAKGSIVESESVRKTMQQNELALSDEIKRTAIQLDAVRNQLKDSIENVDGTQRRAMDAGEDLEQLLKQLASAELKLEAMELRTTVEWDRSEECKQVVLHLELQIESLRSDCEKGKEQVDELSSQSERLHHGLLEADQIILAKQQEILELTESSEGLAKLQIECEIQKQVLMGILAETETQVSKVRELENAASLLETQKDELTKIAAAFCLKEAELDKVLDEIALRRSELELVVQEISVLEIEKGELIRLQTLNEEQTARLHLNGEQIDSKRVQLEQVEAMIQAKNEESDYLQSQINHHRSKIEETSALIMLQDRDFEEKSEQVVVARRLIEEQEAARQTIEKRIADLGRRGNDLEESVLLFEIQLQERSDEKIEADAEIEQLNGMLETLRIENREIVENARSLEDLLAAKTKELEDVENDVSFSLGRVSQLVQATVALTSAKKVAVHELNEKETLIGLASAEVQRLSEVADTLRGQCDVLAPQLGEMKTEIDSLAFKKANMEDEIIRLNEQIVSDLIAPAQELKPEVPVSFIEAQIWDTVVELSKINDQSRNDERINEVPKTKKTIADEIVVSSLEVISPVDANQRDEWDFVLQ